MDNLGNNSFSGENNKPIPFDEVDKPIPLGDSPSDGAPGVSRAPLNLGGGGSKPAPVAKPAPKVAARAPAPRKPAPAATAPAPAAAPVAVAGGRITGMRTFFTKLHAGAMDFLGEQICRWLSENPEINVKMTNITTGDVQGKKTEPNLIITVWY
jgi:hypothetical protein